MSFLKAALATAVVLGLVLVLGGLLLPGTTKVERDIYIDRAPEKVFATVDSFERFNEWSPWSGLDPDTEYSYSGPTAGEGASMTWAGNATVGTGSQQILESRPVSAVVTAIDFGGSRATGTFSLVGEGQGTRVSWTITSDHGYNPLHRWFGALLLERMIGPDLERGLGRLKSLLETAPKR
jgi:carbon monoxide dehydrogenase subunit G